MYLALVSLLLPRNCRHDGTSGAICPPFPPNSRYCIIDCRLLIFLVYTILEKSYLLSRRLAVSLLGPPICTTERLHWLSAGYLLYECGVTCKLDPKHMKHAKEMYVTSLYSNLLICGIDSMLQ